MSRLPLPTEQVGRVRPKAEQTLVAVGARQGEMPSASVSVATLAHEKSCISKAVLDALISVNDRIARASNVA
jgi:hypothetical protein